MKKIFSYSTAAVVKDPSRIFCGWFWGGLFYDISAFLNPRQKWLTNKIPNHWCDKDKIIEIALFACLVDYVENEKDGYKNISYDWSKELAKGYVSQEYVDSIVETDEKILSVYRYIKDERPKLVQEIEEFGDNYFEKEQKLSDKDTEALQTIVALRHYLWT